jgi:hypothetical protein
VDEGTIRTLQNRFDAAELAGDRDTLRELIADDFLSIGPKGFVLDRSEWIDRHELFNYEALDVTEVDIRLYDRTAIVRTIQRNRATYGAERVAIAVRVGQVWVRQVDAWRLAAIQFSPLAED